jgi:hypothetical protein
MTRHLQLVRTDREGRPLPTPLTLELAAAVLEARADRTHRVLISDTLARDVARALRHLAALQKRAS